LLAATDIVNLDEVIGEIKSTWPDDRFLENGFGFCALRNEGEIVCWCTGEYAGGRHIGIGIETVGEWRGRSLATLTASAFVEHCLSEGIEAHWDCWAHNLPSIRVAEKVGFRKVLDYDVKQGAV
jgi:RimJ/RimL family protein N-acetyltransferase